MDIFVDNILQNKYLFILIFIRLSVFFHTLIITGNKKINRLTIFSLTLLISFLSLQVVNYKVSINNLSGFILSIINESLIGIIWAYSVNLIFYIFEFFGGLLDINFGFNSINIFNPLSNQNNTLLSQLYFNFAILIFLINNYHYKLIYLIPKSFEKYNSLFFNLSLMNEINLIINSIVTSIIISMPFILLMLIIEFIFGLINKIIPQLNFFSIGYIVKMLIGMFCVYMISFIITKIIDNVILKILIS